MTVKRLVERPVVRPRPVPGAETSGGFEGHLNDLDSTVLRDLLLRSAVGDQEAFEQFYRLTSPVLMAVIAARRLPSPAVDTLVVETYVAIWCHAPAFAGTGHSLWQWTLTILTDVLSRPLPEQDRPRSTGRPQPTLRPAGRAATTSFWRHRKDRGISMTLDGWTGPG